jgi:hypothetical protein
MLAINPCLFDSRTACMLVRRLRRHTRITRTGVQSKKGARKRDMRGTRMVPLFLLAAPGRSRLCDSQFVLS